MRAVLGLDGHCMLGTCVKSIAGLFGHVAEADCDAVATAGLQSFKAVLHCVVLSGDFIIALRLPHRVSQMHNISLHTATTHPAMMLPQINQQ